MANSTHYFGLESVTDKRVIFGIERVSAWRRGLAPELRQRIEFGLSLRERDTRLHSAKYGKAMRPAISRSGGIDLEGRPDFGRVYFAGWKAKILWHHPNDHALVSVEEDFPADDASIAPKHSLPQAVGDVGGQRRPGIIIFRSQQTSHRRRNAQHAQHSARHKGSGGSSRIAAARNIHPAGDPPIECLQ